MLTEFPPTLKRPRSSSNPPSPTGSSSSKKAASEDLVSSPIPPLDSAPRLEVSPLSNSIIAEDTMTGIPEPEVEDSARTDVDSGSEWVKRTEDVHLDEQVAEGSKSGKEKYEALYNELLSSSPPPFKAYERYYIVPCKLRNDLKAAAFSDDAEAVEVKLDMTPILADIDGEEVFVIDTQVQLDGSTGLVSKGKKERVWDLKGGLQEDDEFLYISEAGWKTLALALGAESGPSLSRFCLPGDRIQLVPPIYTLYQVGTSTTTTSPIRFTCPTETPIPIFIRLLRSLLADSASVDKTSPCRVWQFETLLAVENNDPAAQAALKTAILPPGLVPALASKMVASSGETDTPDTCSRRGFESGDSFVLELGKKISADETDWVMDLTASGHAAVKPTINLPPVPTAPAPLFSQPPKFPGSIPMASSSSQGEGSSGGMFGMTTRAQTKNVQTRGLVGLVNLGNTCFMNSATQCLSNTVELCDYFLSGVYREELNRDNPLGMYGQVAESFGGVVEGLWTSSPSSSFAPRQLKQTTGRFAPQFAGYGQHDTQEFIAFLLDGLHEDLNRIQKKPYVEKPDWKAGGGNRELAELGKECWTGYKKRNDSVIVDLFQGQLMSTLVCPECHKESITMDPFMYLTVPLPIAQHREFKYAFVPRDSELPIVKGKILIPALASFTQVKEKLALLMKCNPTHLVGFDLWKSTIYAWWIDSDHNGEAKDSDVAIFHDVGVPTSASRKSVGTVATDGSITVPVFTFITPEYTSYRRAGEPPAECAQMPFFITLSKAEAADASAVREAIAKGYGRRIGEEAYARMWVPSSSKHAVVPTQEEAEPAASAETEATSGETKVAEVPVASDGSELGSRPASPLLDVRTSTIQHNASSASLSTLASVRSGKIVPRGDLYKVHVGDASTSETASSTLTLFKSKDNVVPLYKGGNPRTASGNWSSLEARRKAKKNILGRLTSGISSIVGGKEEPEAEAPAKDAAASLVVRPGEAIFVEWAPDAYRDHFEFMRDVEEHIDPSIEKERAKKKEGKSISIEDCLDEFSKEETLGQEDLWFCPVCKKHQAATKKLEIYKAPDILVICIKRFGSSRRLSDKLDNLVNFPIEGLDLEERIGERRVAREMKLSAEEAKQFGMEGDKEESWVYDLYAVDNHFGGLGGGHYTAFCKNKEDGEWYNYDDSRVSKADENSIQSRAAYLLFYRRRTVRPIGGVSREKAVEALSRNPSRAVSPTPPSPTLGSGSQPFPSTLRSTFDPTTSSSPADSPLSSSPMTSDDGRLPSYSAGGSFSPPLSPSSRADPTLQLDIDSSDDDNSRGRSGISGMFGTAQNLGFVSAGQPYGGVNWGTSSSQAGPVRHSFNMQDTHGAPPSPPESEDGQIMAGLRQQAAAQFRGPVAEHPATEALAGGEGMDTTDTVSEADSLVVMMEAKRKEKEAQADAEGESGLGEEYGVITPEKADGMEVDGEGENTVVPVQVESVGTADEEKK